MPFFIILAIALALVTVLFALQNTTPVVINIFGWEGQDTLAIIVLITLAIGVVVGILVTTPALLRRSLKLAHQKKRLQDIDYQLQVQQQSTLAEHQAVGQVRSQFQELLAAFALLDPTTGLLKGDLLTPAISYALQTMGTTQAHSTVCLYLLEANPANAEEPNGVLDRRFEQHLYQAMGQRLKAVTVANHWLHHDGEGHFTCIARGLETRSASDYGEAIRSAFADRPLELEDGTLRPTTVSIGGAIALPSTAPAPTTFIQTAEEALEQAKRRGRNRFRLVEVKG